jgi:hypothetical protein
MKTIGMCALALVLMGGVAQAEEGISINLDSGAPTQLAPRRELSDACLAVVSREGSVALMLTNDVVAVQLTDRALSDVEPDKDAGFLEELVVSGVRLALGKSIECPISAIRSAELRGGRLLLTNYDGKPVFNEIKVNGSDVLQSFSSKDAARFVSAFRAAKAR